MNRRQFSIAAMGLAAFPLGAPVSNALVARDPAFESELQKLFSTPQHAVDIGLRYLQAHPEKADRRTLIRDVMGRGVISSTSHDSLPNLVSAWQERDFRDGAVVVLDGWVMARAEVSLCALLYLKQRT